MSRSREVLRRAYQPPWHWLRRRPGDGARDGVSTGMGPDLAFEQVGGDCVETAPGEYRLRPAGDRCGGKHPVRGAGSSLALCLEALAVAVLCRPSWSDAQCKT